MIFGHPNFTWHYWFAWRPVRLSTIHGRTLDHGDVRLTGQIVWLQGVARFKRLEEHTPRRQYVLWSTYAMARMRENNDA